MKVKIGQLRRIIKEELTIRLQEAGELVDDSKFYDLLKNSFTCTVDPEDVRYVRYRLRGNNVGLQDYDGMLGNMDTSASSQELAEHGMTAQQFAEWLAAHGAKALKPARRKRSPMDGPMGGYD